MGKDRTYNSGLGFGRAIDITPDGNRIIVGAPFTNYNNTGVNSGSVKIYHKQNAISVGGFSNVFQLNGLVENDLLGFSVAFVGSDGDYAVAGAPGTNFNLGQVYLMTFMEGVWSKENFGSSQYGLSNAASKLGFSLSGSKETDTFIVGAPSVSSFLSQAYVVDISLSNETSSNSTNETSGYEFSIVSTITASDGEQTGKQVSASTNGKWFGSSGGGDITIVQCSSASTCESHSTLQVSYEGSIVKSSSINIEQKTVTETLVVLVTGVVETTKSNVTRVLQLYSCDNVNALCLGLVSEKLYTNDCDDDFYGYSADLQISGNDEPIVAIGIAGSVSSGSSPQGMLKIMKGFDFTEIKPVRALQGEECGERIGMSVVMSAGTDHIVSGGDGYVRVWSNKLGVLYGLITPISSSSLKETTTYQDDSYFDDAVRTISENERSPTVSTFLHLISV